MSKVFIALFLSFLVISVTQAYSQNQTQTEEWSTYEDPVLGVSIQHPSNSQITEEPNIAKFEEFEDGTSPLFSADVVILPTIGDIGINSSEELMTEILNTLRGTSDVYEIDNETKIKGVSEPVTKAVHNLKIGEIPIGYSASYTIVGDDGKGYKIGFITKFSEHERYIPVIQKMIDSFKFLED